jgi:hypothetical protein
MKKLKPTYKRSVKSQINSRGFKLPPMKDGGDHPQKLKPQLFGVTWG